MKVLFKKVLSKEGFTLLEALVAISILMVAIATPMTIAQKSLSSSIYSKDQMIASYLAQDAIEYIKNQRDNASLNDPINSDWLRFVTIMNNNNCNKEQGCRVDTIKSNGDGEFLLADSSAFLYINNRGLYTYDTTGNNRTNFKRKINFVQSEVNQDEALLTVSVSWGSDSVVVKTLIYNF